MAEFFKLPEPARLDEMAGLQGIPMLDRATCEAHTPDLHLVLVEGTSTCLARCSLWWTRAPVWADERLGLIGHYAAVDEVAGREMLAFARMELGRHGATLAVGPMDGSTWRSYRFVTERGSEPPFFLEPDHPPAWPGHWTSSGFTAWSTYTSALTPDLSVEDPHLAAAERRLAEARIHLRPIDPSDPETDLHRIYDISLQSFRENLLYTPLDRAAFIAMYRPLLPYLIPGLVWLAEQGDEPVGFVFGLPDVLQARRGVTVDTVIVKTVAVTPGQRGGGLGGVLVAACHREARRLGFTRAIHALMHDANPSRRISTHYARPMRGYTLFARPV